MSSGFISNYKDSGYVVPPSIWYNPGGVPITATNFLPLDIYISSQQVGVYMINGTQGQNNGVFYPIFCSLSNMHNLSVPNKVDDAWLVYPGYGFTLFQDPSYNNTDDISNSYLNTLNVPVMFYNPGSPSGFNTGTPIQTTSGSNYVGNSTQSVKIYFRFQEITITGLS